jgi:disulfide bond formation protein DsbB
VATERSDKVYDYYKEASQRFDYFVVGGTGALAAYVGQSIKPHRIALNPESLELLALLFLIGSIGLGLKHIEAIIQLFKHMFWKLHHEEVRGSLIGVASDGSPAINKSTGDVYSAREMLVIAEAHRQLGEETAVTLQKEGERAARYYHWRNKLLLMGFLMLVAAKILPAYLVITRVANYMPGRLGL